MKKLLAILLTTVLMLSLISTDAFVVHANGVISGTTGDCVWTIVDGVLTISGNGAMLDYSYSDPAPYLKYKFDKVVFAEGVTRIGDYAFRGCTELISIKIPSSITSIGWEPFSTCDINEGVYIKDLSKWCAINFATSTSNPLQYANKLYLNGTPITSLTIPRDVTSIEGYAFCGYSSLTNVEMSDNVTHIGLGAFERCGNLTSIKIPDSVTSIGRYAFYECSGLTSIKIPDSVTNIDGFTFYECSGLTSIKIPDSVTSIGGYAFYGCASLTSIEIPNSVTSIGRGAFKACDALEEMTLPFIGGEIAESDYSGLGYLFGGSKECIPKTLKKIVIDDACTEIGDYAFSGASSLLCVEIPNSITYIGKNAFSGCSNLTSIKIPDSLVNIGEYAFCDWNGLINIEIPRSVISIGDSAFEGCENLKSIEIPNSVTSIGSRAFHGCNDLTSIEIPHGVTSIGKGMFGFCRSLTSMEIPSSVIRINGDAFYACTSLTNIKIPDSVTEIGRTAFFECSSLTSIEFPKNLTSIENLAFGGCRSLTSIKIPDSVTSIGGYVFFGCTSLTSIEIPNSVTSIEALAFSGCSNLKDIWYHGSESERKNISIDTDNEALTSATWHYDTCLTTNHVYSTNCDPYCDNCDWVRTINTDVSSSHVFTLNNELTCKFCAYSKKPDMPQMKSKTSKIVILVADDIFEYSMDGVTWQDNGVFTGLSPNTTYVFYQRVKATNNSLISEESDGLIVTTKMSQEMPSAPIISNYTELSVTLIPIENGEYSIDKKNWQTSNVFTNLLAGEEYTFYQRYAETDTHDASLASNGTGIMTHKFKQPLVPETPTVQSFTSSSITLVMVEGFEYSMDGAIWQTSNVFANLSCGTEYTFYQRYEETSTTYAGEKSACLTVKTDKGTQTAPSQPILISKTYDTVTLILLSGYEYSVDGINWQTSNVFTELNSNTDYSFYQRKMETDTHYASPVSSSLEVRTNEKPTYKVGDLDGDSELTDWDGVMLARYLAGWQVNIATLETLDIDKDGEITDWDGVMLDRYLAGWNIQIGGKG